MSVKTYADSVYQLLLLTALAFQRFLSILARVMLDCFQSRTVLMRHESSSSGFSLRQLNRHLRMSLSGDVTIAAYALIILTTFRLNGGPGCSSLSGLLTENGPFTWMSGTLAPVQNPYSWTNLTNMLFVEQPIGVGYSQGTPNITNEVELATEFRGFYKQFVDTFQTKSWKTYITGESYAGYYVRPSNIGVG